MSRPIVLLTDFGSDDFYAGVMHAVLVSSAPSSTIVDLTHDIPAHDVDRASFVLARTLAYLPPRAVVVVVVDPGVGSARRAIAIEVDDWLLVGPDNGFASDVLVERGGARLVHIDESAALKAVGGRPRGATFHGRDLFAPVAAAIARGSTPGEFGTATDRVVMLRDVPSVSVDGGCVRARGRHVDRFGNVLSDVSRTVLEHSFGAALERVRVRVGGHELGALRRTYADGAAGELFALLNSWDVVEVAINGGRACERLGPEGVRFELYHS